jgi:hypothetical protein
VNQVSLVRLYLLRATYLLIAVGLALMIWPLLINKTPNVEHMRGVVWSLLGAVGVLAAIGIRYPLQMLPVLLFEFLWKSIWLVAIGLPLRSAGTFTPGTQSTWNDCLISIPIFLVAIPWGYVFDNYVRRPSDRWTSRQRAQSDPVVSASA